MKNLTFDHFFNFLGCPNKLGIFSIIRSPTFLTLEANTFYYSYSNFMQKHRMDELAKGGMDKQTNRQTKERTGEQRHTHKTLR